MHTRGDFDTCPKKCPLLFDVVSFVKELCIGTGKDMYSNLVFRKLAYIWEKGNYDLFSHK
jgi:hypothetical protein